MTNLHYYKLIRGFNVVLFIMLVILAFFCFKCIPELKSEAKKLNLLSSSLKTDSDKVNSNVYIYQGLKSIYNNIYLSQKKTDPNIKLIAGELSNYALPSYIFTPNNYSQISESDIESINKLREAHKEKSIDSIIFLKSLELKNNAKYLKDNILLDTSRKNVVDTERYDKKALIAEIKFIEEKLREINEQYVKQKEGQKTTYLPYEKELFLRLIGRNPVAFASNKNGGKVLKIIVLVDNKVAFKNSIEFYRGQDNSYYQKKDDIISFKSKLNSLISVIIKNSEGENICPNKLFSDTGKPIELQELICDNG